MVGVEDGDEGDVVDIGATEAVNLVQNAKGSGSCCRIRCMSI